MSRLVLSFLGPPLVELDGVPIVLKLRKAMALLAYVAVTDGRRGRDELAEMLFARQDRDRGRSNLRQALSLLRDAIGDHIGADKEAVWLPDSPHLRVDVRAFRELLAVERGAENADRLAEAAALFRGEFMAGFFLKDSPGFEQWQESQRDDVRRARASLLQRLADHHAARGEWTAAIDRARQRLALDPLDESSHRGLIGLLARSGGRSAALRQYERCRELLRKNLGEHPDPGTEELHRQVLAGSVDTAIPGRPAGRAGRLPVFPTSLVGRETEIAAVLDSLRRKETRLLTLSGPGGVGKTRLAVEAASRALKRYRDGVFFVDLSTLHDPVQVAPAIAAALGIREIANEARALEVALMDGLGSRHLLLVMDTFEHLQGASPGVAGLLAACAGLTVLATSREPLHLRAEHVMPVPPLALAPAGSSNADLASSASVRLFTERASAALPGFRVTPQNAEAVSGICARLDGLPLPIELAAAKVKTMSPTALEELLERTLVLKGGPRDAPARQQGLRSEIDWSYRLLDDRERTLFQRLGVFAGGCTVEAAAAVCRDAPTPEAIDIVDTLGSLVEKCLLQQHEVDGATRYRMLQCIREFALERLGDDGASGPVHGRFADWCIDLAERAAAGLYGAGQAVWLGSLDGEYVNLRAALEWLAAQRDRLRGARLAGALGWFWLMRSDFTVAQRWLERFRSMAEAGDLPGPRAVMAFCLGMAHSALALQKFRNVAARNCFRESADLWRRSADQPMLARALVLQAEHEFDLPREAVNAIVDEGILTARNGDDPWTLAFCLAFGTSAYGRAPPPEAEANLQEAIGGARATGDPWLYAEALRPILGLVDTLG